MIFILALFIGIGLLLGGLFAFLYGKHRETVGSALSRV